MSDNNIILNKFRIKEVLAYRGKSITWLATQTVQSNGRFGCDKATLMNYIRDGFARKSADSVVAALKVPMTWLQSEMGV